MHAIAVARLLRAVMVASMGAALAPAQALTTSLTVTVTVKLASSSGICGVTTSNPVVGVSCGTGAHRLITLPGTASYQRVGIIPASSVVAEPLSVYSDGVKITSWRIVKLDNADYVELTVAW